MATRVNLKGVTPIHRKLADGTPVTYWYAWRGGPLIKDKKGKPAQPHQPVFVQEYSKLTEERDAVGGDTVATLIAEYLQSSDFKSKGTDTRREYERYLTGLPKKFKEMKIKTVQKVAMRSHFKQWRDGMSDKPRAADYAWASVARVLSYAKDNGRIAINILEKPGRLSKPDRAEIIWADEDLAKMEAEASPEVMLAIRLSLNTSQRRGDVLKLPWSAYDGEFFKLRQGKTKAYVKIPVFGHLKEMLDNTPRRSTTILTNTRGRSWTPTGFDSSFQKARARAGITGLTFHDLRGTAVTHLAKAGCTNAEIASYTGHSLEDVDHILDAHYMGGRAALAESAGIKLKAYQDRRVK